MFHRFSHMFDMSSFITGISGCLRYFMNVCREVDSFKSHIRIFISTQDPLFNKYFPPSTALDGIIKAMNILDTELSPSTFNNLRTVLCSARFLLKSIDRSLSSYIRKIFLSFGNDDYSSIHNKCNFLLICHHFGFSDPIAILAELCNLSRSLISLITKHINAKFSTTKLHCADRITHHIVYVVRFTRFLFSIEELIGQLIDFQLLSVSDVEDLSSLIESKKEELVVYQSMIHSKAQKTVELLSYNINHDSKSILYGVALLEAAQPVYNIVPNNNVDMFDAVKPGLKRFYTRRSIFDEMLVNDQRMDSPFHRLVRYYGDFFVNGPLSKVVDFYQAKKYIDKGISKYISFVDKLKNCVGSVFLEILSIQDLVLFPIPDDSSHPSIYGFQSTFISDINQCVSAHYVYLDRISDSILFFLNTVVGNNRALVKTMVKYWVKNIFTCLSRQIKRQIRLFVKKFISVPMFHSSNDVSLFDTLPTSLQALQSLIGSELKRYSTCIMSNYQQFDLFKRCKNRFQDIVFVLQTQKEINEFLTDQYSLSCSIRDDIVTSVFKLMSSRWTMIHFCPEMIDKFLQFEQEIYDVNSTLFNMQSNLSIVNLSTEFIYLFIHDHLWCTITNVLQHIVTTFIFNCLYFVCNFSFNFDELRSSKDIIQLLPFYSICESSFYTDMINFASFQKQLSPKHMIGSLFFDSHVNQKFQTKDFHTFLKSECIVISELSDIESIYPFFKKFQLDTRGIYTCVFGYFLQFVNNVEKLWKRVQALFCSEAQKIIFNHYDSKLVTFNYYLCECGKALESFKGINHIVVNDELFLPSFSKTRLYLFLHSSLIFIDHCFHCLFNILTDLSDLGVYFEKECNKCILLPIDVEIVTQRHNVYLKLRTFFFQIFNFFSLSSDQLIDTYDSQIFHTEFEKIKDSLTFNWKFSDFIQVLEIFVDNIDRVCNFLDLCNLKGLRHIQRCTLRSVINNLTNVGDLRCNNILFLTRDDNIDVIIKIAEWLNIEIEIDNSISLMIENVRMWTFNVLRYDDFFVFDYRSAINHCSDLNSFIQDMDQRFRDIGEDYNTNMKLYSYDMWTSIQNKLSSLRKFKDQLNTMIVIEQLMIIIFMFRTCMQGCDVTEFDIDLDVWNSNLARVVQHSFSYRDVESFVESTVDGFDVFICDTLINRSERIGIIRMCDLIGDISNEKFIETFFDGMHGMSDYHTALKSKFLLLFDHMQHKFSDLHYFKLFSRYESICVFSALFFALNSQIKLSTFINQGFILNKIYPSLQHFKLSKNQVCGAVNISSETIKFNEAIVLHEPNIESLISWFKAIDNSIVDSVTAVSEAAKFIVIENGFDPLALVGIPLGLVYLRIIMTFTNDFKVLERYMEHGNIIAYKEHLAHSTANTTNILSYLSSFISSPSQHMLLFKFIIYSFYQCSCYYESLENCCDVNDFVHVSENFIFCDSDWNVQFGCVESIKHGMFFVTPFITTLYEPNLYPFFVEVDIFKELYALQTDDSIFMSIESTHNHALMVLYSFSLLIGKEVYCRTIGKHTPVFEIMMAIDYVLETGSLLIFLVNKTLPTALLDPLHLKYLQILTGETKSCSSAGVVFVIHEKRIHTQFLNFAPHITYSLEANNNIKHLINLRLLLSGSQDKVAISIFKPYFDEFCTLFNTELPYQFYNAIIMFYFELIKGLLTKQRLCTLSHLLFALCSNFVSFNNYNTFCDMHTRYFGSCPVVDYSLFSEVFPFLRRVSCLLDDFVEYHIDTIIREIKPDLPNRALIFHRSVFFSSLFLPCFIVLLPQTPIELQIGSFLKQVYDLLSFDPSINVVYMDILHRSSKDIQKTALNSVPLYFYLSEESNISPTTSSRFSSGGSSYYDSAEQFEDHSFTSPFLSNDLKQIFVFTTCGTVESANLSVNFPVIHLHCNRSLSLQRYIKTVSKELLNYYDIEDVLFESMDVFHVALDLYEEFAPKVLNKYDFELHNEIINFVNFAFTVLGGLLYSFFTQSNVSKFHYCVTKFIPNAVYVSLVSPLLVLTDATEMTSRHYDLIETQLGVDKLCDVPYVDLKTGELGCFEYISGLLLDMCQDLNSNSMYEVLMRNPNQLFFDYICCSFFTGSYYIFHRDGVLKLSNQCSYDRKTVLSMIFRVCSTFTFAFNLCNWNVCNDFSDHNTLSNLRLGHTIHMAHELNLFDESNVIDRILDNNAEDIFLLIFYNHQECIVDKHWSSRFTTVRHPTSNNNSIFFSRFLKMIWGERESQHIILLKQVSYYFQLCLTMFHTFGYENCNSIPLKLLSDIFGLIRDYVAKNNSIQIDYKLINLIVTHMVIIFKRYSIPKSDSMLKDLIKTTPLTQSQLDDQFYCIPACEGIFFNRRSCQMMLAERTDNPATVFKGVMLDDCLRILTLSGSENVSSSILLIKEFQDSGHRTSVSSFFFPHFLEQQFRLIGWKSVSFDEEFDYSIGTSVYTAVFISPHHVISILRDTQRSKHFRNKCLRSGANWRFVVLVVFDEQISSMTKLFGNYVECIRMKFNFYNVSTLKFKFSTMLSRSSRFFPVLMSQSVNYLRSLQHVDTILTGIYDCINTSIEYSSVDARVCNPQKNLTDSVIQFILRRPNITVNQASFLVRVGNGYSFAFLHCTVVTFIRLFKHISVQLNVLRTKLNDLSFVRESYINEIDVIDNRINSLITDTNVIRKEVENLDPLDESYGKMVNTVVGSDLLIENLKAQLNDKKKVISDISEIIEDIKLRYPMLYISNYSLEIGALIGFHYLVIRNCCERSGFKMIKQRFEKILHSCSIDSNLLDSFSDLFVKLPSNELDSGMQNWELYQKLSLMAEVAQNIVIGVSDNVLFSNPVVLALIPFIAPKRVVLLSADNDTLSSFIPIASDCYFIIDLRTKDCVKHFTPLISAIIESKRWDKFVTFDDLTIQPSWSFLIMYSSNLETEMTHILPLIVCFTTSLNDDYFIDFIRNNMLLSMKNIEPVKQSFVTLTSLYSLFKGLSITEHNVNNVLADISNSNLLFSKTNEISDVDDIVLDIFFTLKASKYVLTQFSLFVFPAHDLHHEGIDYSIQAIIGNQKDKDSIYERLSFFNCFIFLLFNMKFLIPSVLLFAIRFHKLRWPTKTSVFDIINQLPFGCNCENATFGANSIVDHLLNNYYSDTFTDNDEVRDELKYFFKIMCAIDDNVMFGSYFETLSSKDIFCSFDSSLEKFVFFYCALYPFTLQNSCLLPILYKLLVVSTARTPVILDLFNGAISRARLFIKLTVLGFFPPYHFCTGKTSTFVEFRRLCDEIAWEEQRTFTFIELQNVFNVNLEHLCKSDFVIFYTVYGLDWSIIRGLMVKLEQLRALGRVATKNFVFFIVNKRAIDPMLRYIVYFDSSDSSDTRFKFIDNVKLFCSFNRVRFVDGYVNSRLRTAVLFANLIRISSTNLCFSKKRRLSKVLEPLVEADVGKTSLPVLRRISRKVCHEFGQTDVVLDDIFGAIKQYSLKSIILPSLQLNLQDIQTFEDLIFYIVDSIPFYYHDSEVIDIITYPSLFQKLYNVFVRDRLNNFSNNVFSSITPCFLNVLNLENTANIDDIQHYRKINAYAQHLLPLADRASRFESFESFKTHLHIGCGFADDTLLQLVYNIESTIPIPLSILSSNTTENLQIAINELHQDVIKRLQI
ncbi:hypothetical protein PCE1_004462 [Barthelona sp. PCE]